MVLLPIFLFALLHLLSFVLRVLNETNRQGNPNEIELNFFQTYTKIIFSNQVNYMNVFSDLLKCIKFTFFK